MTAAMTAPADAALARTLEQWDGPMTCVEVVEVTHDVRSFVLSGADPDATYDFWPGQYVTITAPLPGGPVGRCYTVSSTPGSATLSITVKNKAGGTVSPWLHEHLRPGDTLQVSGPLGGFTYLEHPAPRYLMLSAGSGITPLMSMLRHLHAEGTDADVVFAHSARTPRDLIFGAELAQAARERSDLRLVTICESDPDGTWDGLLGRLTGEILRARVPDLADREVFLCGPEPYMVAARALLLAAGHDPRRCHEESFDIAKLAPISPASPASPAGEHTVELRRSGRTIRCGASTTLLAAAAEAGLSLPSSCTEGVCGTCKTDLISGSVDLRHNGGIRPREIAAGKILLCSSTPLEDLVLDA